ncbi:hypothetical protein MKX03_019371 [Papaver bracteatum]|nr:hypothetical protein MKX03_019371 [Papaver bracteatum]
MVFGSVRLSVRLVRLSVRFCAALAVFGCKYKNAVVLYEEAATHYRYADAFNEAAKVYIKLASYHLKLGRKDEAASAYVDAAYLYKRIYDKDAAISCFDQAVDQFKEIGKIDMAAVYCGEIGELYDAKKDLDNSIVYFKKANDLSLTSSWYYMHKVAQLYAQLEQYPRAIQIYEHLAKQSFLNDYHFNDMHMKGYLLNAGLCHLYEFDAAVAIFKALKRYVAMDPTFLKTREHKILADLAAAVYEEHVQRFNDVVKQLKIDGMNRDDDWKITLLSRVKKNLI